jgi:DNA-binding NarL/FixJ family response regulator
MTMSQPDVQLEISLTERQQRVLWSVSEGFSNKEIAAVEGVSEGAVKATLQQLFRKTLVRRRAQLVRLAIESALVRDTNAKVIVITRRRNERDT